MRENSKSLRTLFVTSALEREFGGPPEAVVGVSCALAQNGTDVNIYVYGQTTDSVERNSAFFARLESSKVRIILAKAKKLSVYGGFGSIGDLLNLRREVQKADWISIHGVYKFENLSAYVLAKIYKTPFSLMPHGTLTRYQRKIHKFRKLPFDVLLKFSILKAATRIFVATNIEREELPRYLRKKAVVVGLGINNPRIHFTNELDLYRNKFLFVGRLASKKRVDLAIAAFEIFCETHQQEFNSLEIYGKGDIEYEEYLQQLIINSRFGRNISLKGWLNSEDKMDVYTSSDYFLLTSEDENFAISVAEALSYGLPCVLSENVALSQLVKIYKAGGVFSKMEPRVIADSMSGAVNADKLTMKKASLKAAQTLDWHKVSKEWETFMREALSP